MKRAIVTGASGFVGCWLVRKLLEQKVEVTAIELEGSTNLNRLPLGQQNFKLILISPNSQDALSKNISDIGFDVFYNLAWSGAGGPKRADYSLQLNNVKTCLDYLMEAEKLCCKKFICAGTIGEYMAELALERRIVSENYMYATAKSVCHKMLCIAEHNLHCEVIWTTFCGLYGSLDTTANLINYTIKGLIQNTNPSYGPCGQLFDFLHISDCVEALYRVGFMDTISKTFLIGSGQPRMLKDYLNEIPAILNFDNTLRIGVRNDDGTIYRQEWFDNSILVKETGFVPQYSFHNGILETYEWLKEFMKQ